MANKEQKFDWEELKDIWVNSAQTKKINIQMSGLLDELKGKVSQFEKDSINSDVATLKTNWEQFKGMTSQFEKDSINKDMANITSLIRKFLNLFTKNKE
jgi:ASC-1-like (ASCH) protein